MCKWKFSGFQPQFTVTEAGPWWNGGPITHFGSVNQAFCKWRQTIRAYIGHWDAPSRKPGTDIEMLYGTSVLTMSGFGCCVSVFRRVCK